MNNSSKHTATIAALTEALRPYLAYADKYEARDDLTVVLEPITAKAPESGEASVTIGQLREFAAEPMQSTTARLTRAMEATMRELEAAAGKDAA